MTKLSFSEPNYELIYIAKIHPNQINPNRMPRKEFQAYRAECRRLGRLPKPLVVRPHREIDGEFEIVDGEHGYRISKEEGWSEVQCEIIEADDFELMKQCYNRNRGGENDPVLLGQMFGRMMKLKKLSERGLAKNLKKSPGTIANYMKYAEAAELRSSYAGEDRRDEIGSLAIRQVRMYCRLPDAMRDVWLDAGGDLDSLAKFYERDVSQILYLLDKADMYRVLQPNSEFVSSLDLALELAKWRNEHFLMDHVDDYIRPVADLGIDVSVLEHLPCSIVNDVAQPLLPPKTWEAILGKQHEHASDIDGLLALVASSVRIALRDSGVDLEVVYGPQLVEMMQLLSDAPDFIRQSDCLCLEEQYYLAQLEIDAPEDVVLAAKQATCKFLQAERGVPNGQESNGCASGGHSVDAIFEDELTRLYEQAQLAERDELFADRQALFGGIVEHLAECPDIRSSKINGRPACDVLAERLDALDWPEFFLLASLVLSADAVDDACRRWLAMVETSG